MHAAGAERVEVRHPLSIAALPLVGKQVEGLQPLSPQMRVSLEGKQLGWRRALGDCMQRG